ncbi:hypothetical protein IG206_00790 [Candidatus Parvarchaeota archaeon]|nr:hypothetical protein [Candidatus Acidifodinimicrobium mancum]
MDKHGQFLSAVLVMMLALIMIAMFSVYAMILEGNGNVYTSLTSSSISSYMAEQIANQYSNIMPFSSSVNSTFSGMLKNFIAGYYPSYVLADSLLNYTNLIYDYAMPPNVTVPNSVKAYVSVILNNTQSSPTPAPFQQMINVPNTTSFWSYINTTSGYFGQNVEFFYGNGKIIPSWLESYNSSSGRWWIKTGTISASSVTKIYMGFASKTTNLFNANNVGEAPQLSSTYGQYDNGANVFTNYWNFAGTSLPSGWATSDTSGISVNNGVQINDGSVYTTSSVFTSLNNIEEMYAKYTALNSGNYAGIMQSNAQSPQGGNTGSNAEILWMTNRGSNVYYAWSANGASASYNIQNGISSSFTPNLNRFYIIGTYVSNNIVGERVNYTNSLTASGTFNTSQYIILGYFTGSGAGTVSINPLFVQWIRVRAYPPNGVMPSVYFGGVA